MMMHRPLRIAEILEFAAENYATAEIVSRTVEGGIHRTNYADTAARVRRVARALLGLGVAQGDRVATLAWNGYRHFELYYAISGIGAVCHTINPRLSAEQMTYIVNHAEDSILCLDLTFLPIVEGLKDAFPADMRYVILTDRAHMPETNLPGAMCYEDLVDAESDGHVWAEFPEETAAALCYTSGTTGNPKGALYSHRSTVLHALSAGISFQRCLRPSKRILPVVPLFHVNAWGLPYAVPITGGEIIFPGPKLDGESLWELMDAEKVFSTWGVPTVWLGLLAEIKKRGRKPEGFGEVIIGGSAAPPTMIAAFEEMGVGVCHAWGMTEMSPIGTQGLLPPAINARDQSERMRLKAKQGRRIFGVDLKIVAEDGTRLPHDGEAAGTLFVRGNSVVSGYFRNQEATDEVIDDEGWFSTGDVASIDEEGFLAITDRAKDLIKSGGEWISSIDVENLALAHPGIANCAVIAVPDEKWGERPLLVAVAAGDPPADADVQSHLAATLARWQVPQTIEWVESLPLTATGKVSKLTLRRTFAAPKPAE